MLATEAERACLGAACCLTRLLPAEDEAELAWLWGGGLPQGCGLLPHLFCLLRKQIAMCNKPSNAQGSAESRLSKPGG